MRVRNLFVASAIAIGLAACGSDGIDLNVSTTDNSVDNSTGNGGGGDGNNPCANYTTATNTVVRGTFDGTNCRYSSSFVGATNPLTVDLTIPLISGVHIFQDSLFVGTNVSSGAAPAAGTGPTLTIEAGSTLAFSDSSDYVLINRGSQIIAEGSAAAPITFTGYTDAVTGTAGPEDVQLWGGIVINGNGITNNCTDAERAANQCHVVSEGQPSNYGGNSNTESSGVLRYVVVKHTGFEVAPGDELNGITFNAVGSGTTVENVEVYSTYDDGVEFFGGAVNVTNLVALYVRDDSIDFSDGYVGTVENALVIHSAENSNRCIEGDNIGETRAASQPLDLAPISNPTITRMTCITSNKDQSDGGTHGDSEGVLFRFGARGSLQDSIVFAGYPTPSRATNPSNECIEIESSVSLAAAAAGNTVMTGNIVACSEAVKGTLANADTLTSWFEGANPSAGGANYSFNVENRIFAAPSAAASPLLRVLEPSSFYTAPAFADAAGAAFTVGTPARPIGAVRRANDWTANWTYGLHASNRGQPLWFQ
jgi:hypothetical protein